MISFKKFLFSLASVSLMVPAITSLNSCGIVKNVNPPDDKHPIDFDSNKIRIKVNGTQTVNIKNFNALSKLGLTSIAVLDIKIEIQFNLIMLTTLKIILLL